MACPVCNSNQFYIKDPEDAFEIYEFEYRKGVMHFTDPETADQAPELKPDAEIFCQRCAWHGQKKRAE